MPIALPPGYVLERVGRVLAAAREPAIAFVRHAVAESGTLHAWARTHAHAVLGGGRADVPVIAGPGGAWAVRHYQRGGAVAGLLGDRYLRGAAPRPFAELALSEALRAAGIDTPQVQAALVYPDGAWYRGDIATELVPDAADLATLSLGPESWPEPERIRAWEAAGRLLAAFFATGAVHPDLNLRNVLVARVGRAQLLDLDRCSIPGPPRAAARERMLARFHRSRRKLERAGRTVGAAELAAFARELDR